MSSNYSRLEEAVFEAIIPNLESEGYEVFVRPAERLLPQFMAGYRPDAIAVKAGKKIAIEVKSSHRDPRANVSRLQDVFAGHPEWELRVIYAPPRDGAPIQAALPREMIERSLRSVQGILEQFGPVTALLMGWSVFEAAARCVLPGASGQASPAKLVQALASEGIVTPDEADELRKVGDLRNKAAHGGLDVAASQAQIERLVQVTSLLLRSTELEKA